MKTNLFSRQPEPDPGSSVPLRPSLPLAKRLNRNALTVAAVLMGMTVLTAIVVLNPGAEEHNAPTGSQRVEEPPVPSRPTFLDEPVRDSSVRDTSSVPDRMPSSGQDTTPLPPTSPELPGSPAYAVRSPPQKSEIDPYGAYQPSPSLGTSSRESPREQAFRAALTSSVLLGASAQSGHASQSSSESVMTDEEQLLRLGDSILRAAVRQPPVITGAPSNQAASAPMVGTPSGAESRGRAFLERAGDVGGTTVIAQLEPAGSPYTLRAGTVIPGTLITGINADLPGEIVAQVSRDVYDSQRQQSLLVPRGSRLIGTYDNQVVAGQGRLLVAWTRLILPDGRSMRLPGLALKDPQGQTGAKDKVDNHWRRVFGNALLLSAIGAGGQLSQPQQASVLAPPSAGQIAAGALGQELSNVALEVLRRGMDVAPTLTIRPGQPFNVFLNGDVVFDRPYENHSHAVR